MPLMNKFLATAVRSGIGTVVSDRYPGVTVASCFSIVSVFQ